MEEQLIKYETAILAKEKGFNEHCKKEYVETLEHTLDCRGGEYTFPHQSPRILDIGIKERYDIVHAKAPAQSLLQKWLREKKHRNIRIGSTSLTCHFPYVEKIYEDGTQMVSIDFKGNYKSYEDALEFGIQEALRTIL